MSELLTSTFLSTVIVTCILGAMPLMLAAVGEAVSEEAGVLKLGIEGMMLVGGYVAYVLVLQTHSIWIGMLAGALAGAVSSLAMTILNVWFGLNQIVVGIAVTLAGAGITSVLYEQLYGETTPRVDAMAPWRIPGLSEIPIVGTSIFSQPAIFWVSIALVVVMWWFMTKTNWSLSLRAAGQKPSSLDAAGGSVMRTRSQSVVIGGIFAGLGGAYLALLVTGAFTPFMTHGVGYVAIIIAMLTRRRILWIIWVSFLYGLTVSLGTVLQLTTAEVPTDVVDMLPSIAVMIVLIIFARSVYIPPALAAPYSRGTR